MHFRNPPFLTKTSLFLLLFIALSFTSLNAQRFTGTEISPQPAPILEKALTEYQVFQLDIAALNSYIRADDYDGNLVLNFGNKTWDMVLTEDDIRAENYLVRAMTETGIVEVSRGENITFAGFLNDDGASTIRLTIKNDFLHGVVRTSEGEYFIEPARPYAAAYDEQTFIVYNVKDVKVDSEIKCGVTEVRDFQEKQNEVQPQTEPTAESSSMVCMQVELAILSDYSYFLDRGGSDIEDVLTQTIAVMNAVNTDYDNAFANEIRFRIVEQMISTCADCDPITENTDAGNVLNSFSTWGAGGGFINAHDLGQFWTDRDFDGSTKGVAWLGSVCSNSTKYHVLEDYSSTIEHRLRVLTSHEIGHNFDCDHVGNTSTGLPVNIMYPSVQNTTNWAAASIAAVNSYVASASCLGTCSSPCDAITDLDVTNTNSNVTATWVGTASDYRVRLYDMNNTVLSTNIVSGNTLTLMNVLSRCNEYKISVESNCGGSTYALPVSTIFKTDFTTDFELICVTPMNCASGTYSLEIQLSHGGGNASGFTVTADGVTQSFSFGASPQTVTVTGLTANGNANTNLSVAAVSNGGGACDALSTYQEPDADCAGIIFTEKFNACLLPEGCGWSVSTTSANDDFNYQFDWVNGSHINYPTGSFDGSCFAYLDDDATSNPTYTGVATMTSPVIDLSDYTGVTLQFDYNFHNFEDSKPANNSEFMVEVYNGTAWVNVLTDNNDETTCRWFDVWDATDNCLTAASININTFLNANFQMRFIYTDGGTGDWTGMIAIDNIEIDADAYTGGCTQVNYYLDGDGDSFGAGAATAYCPGEQPANFVTNNTDCDDGNMNIFPGATEVCDGVDNNCNNQTDEGFDIDADTVADCIDNCPNDPNPGQEDANSNGVGDACECDPTGIPMNLMVNNDPIPDATYRATNQITSTGVAPANSVIDFITQYEVILQVGFCAKATSDFEAKIQDCAAAILEEETPESLALEKNENTKLDIEKFQAPTLRLYPNPANENTTIELEAMVGKTVSLQVFNAQGNLMETLMQNQMMNVSKEKVQLNTSQLPTGIYSVLLRTRDENIVRRLVVTRGR